MNILYIEDFEKDKKKKNITNLSCLIPFPFVPLFTKKCKIMLLKKKEEEEDNFTFKTPDKKQPRIK